MVGQWCLRQVVQAKPCKDSLPSLPWAARRSGYARARNIAWFRCCTWIPDDSLTAPGVTRFPFCATKFLPRPYCPKRSAYPSYVRALSDGAAYTHAPGDWMLGRKRLRRHTLRMCRHASSRHANSHAWEPAAASCVRLPTGPYE